jgi:hypothetical protein
VPVFGDLLASLSDGHWLAYVSVILPMGLFSVIGSLQNIESAEAAGDSFATRPALAVNGLGTLAAALFGSCFPTTIYIGHPGWKAMGARAGYSVLNAAFFTVVCFSGTLAWIAWAVPIDAGMAIVLWIGMVITAQAFQATPREHAPAWSWVSCRASRPGARCSPRTGCAPRAWVFPAARRFHRSSFPPSPDRTPGSTAPSRSSRVHPGGDDSLGDDGGGDRAPLSHRGALVRHRRACSRPSGCCTLRLHARRHRGLAHAGWPWAAGYAIMGLIFLLARWVTVEGEGALK